MPPVNFNARLEHAASVEANDAQVTVHFDNIADTIAQLLHACDEACACVAWLKMPQLCQALPLNSRVIVQSESHLVLHNFAPGVLVRKCGQARGGSMRPLMHNKFCVLYARNKPTHVITGSFNWTTHSTANLENIVVISGSNAVVHAYVQEFERIWNIARPVTCRRRRRRAAV